MEDKPTMASPFSRITCFVEGMTRAELLDLYKQSEYDIESSCVTGYTDGRIGKNSEFASESEFQREHARLSELARNINPAARVHSFYYPANAENSLYRSDLAVNLKVEIARRVMHWQVEDGIDGKYYREEGRLKKLPEFCISESGHDLLRQTLQSRGEILTVTELPPDLEKGIGRTFTASLNRRNMHFESTRPDERMATCVVALKAYGFTITDD